MSVKDKYTAVQKNTNVAQKAVVAIIVPIVVLLIARWAIDEFIHYDPSDLEETWWGWAIAFAIIGVIEFFWLKTPSGTRASDR